MAFNPSPGRPQSSSSTNKNDQTCPWACDTLVSADGPVDDSSTHYFGDLLAEVQLLWEGDGGKITHIYTSDPAPRGLCGSLRICVCTCAHFLHWTRAPGVDHAQIVGFVGSPLQLMSVIRGGTWCSHMGVNTTSGYRVGRSCVWPACVCPT